MPGVLSVQETQRVELILPKILVDAIDAYRVRLVPTKSRSRMIAEFCVMCLEQRGIKLSPTDVTNAIDDLDV